jgi:ADP-heptose:LPS heptosyltransferase
MLVKTRDKLLSLAARQRLTILLVRPDGIGDEILCLPVATALRRSFSDARILFLSSEHAAPVLEHHPDLDGILTVAGHEPFRKLVALFRDRIDAVIFLKPSRRLMAAAFVARVPVRVATGFRWYSIFANRRMYQHRSDFAHHESEYNLQLLAGLGMKPGTLARPRLVVTTQEREWAEDRMARLPTPRILIHPGGLSARHWKMQHSWDLAKQLLCKGYGVILTGSQAEQQRWERECGDANVLHSNILDLKGELTVRQLMAVIATSQVVISGATGPAHIAAALDVPTVSIYDPRRNNTPIRWRPLGKGLLLRPDVPTCEKCIYEACPYWDCLDQITVEELVMSIEEVLNRSVWYRSASHTINI